MKTHLPEEQISALLDHQLEDDEARSVERHLAGCDHCRAVRDGFAAVDQAFRKVDALEPPSYLWSKISAGLEEAAWGREGWIARLTSPFAGQLWARTQVWTLAASLLIAVTVATVHWAAVRSEGRRLAEIDRVYQQLMPRNAESYNPFAIAPQIDTRMNPFNNNNLRTNQESIHPAGKR